MGLAQQAYTSLLRLVAARRGLPWTVDAHTTLRVDPRCRWIRNDAYERQVVEYLRAGIQPGDVCLDVGGHVGFYVMQMALWTGPTGRVIAFEPNPTARAVLQANVRLNHFDDRVRIEAAAAGALDGQTAQLFHARDTSGLSRLDAPNPQAARGGSVAVPVVTLDGYCAAHDLMPSWILIDVEGYEIEVLRGARRLLRDPRVHVVVEVHAPLWRPDAVAAETFRAIADECGRVIVPLTGQGDALADYGSVALVGQWHRLCSKAMARCGEEQEKGENERA